VIRVRFSRYSLLLLFSVLILLPYSLITYLEDLPFAQFFHFSMRNLYAAQAPPPPQARVRSREWRRLTVGSKLMTKRDLTTGDNLTENNNGKVFSVRT
jgi:hypothetical protein